MSRGISLFVIAQVCVLALCGMLDLLHPRRRHRLLAPPLILVNPVVQEIDPLRVVQLAWTVVLAGTIVAVASADHQAGLQVPTSVIMALGLTSALLPVGHWLSEQEVHTGTVVAAHQRPSWSQLVRRDAGDGTARLDVGRVLVLVTGVLAAAAYEASVASWLTGPQRSPALPDIPTPVLAVLLLALLLFLGPRAITLITSRVGHDVDGRAVGGDGAPAPPTWWWIPLVVVYIIPLRYGAASILDSSSLSSEEQWRVYWLLSLISFGVVVIAGTGWHRNWSVFGGEAPRRTRRTVAIGALGTLVVLTETFAAATAVTYKFGITPARPMLDATSDYRRLEGFYAWHLLDSLPQLDAAKTLQLKTHVTLPGHANGVLLLGYKALVLVPVIAALVWLVKGTDREAGPDPKG